MKKAALDARPTGSAAAKKETGRDYDAWFALLDGLGEKPGRAAMGKALQAENVDAWWITSLMVEYERARGMVEKDGRPRGYSLCVTKTITAPPARVFRAWTVASDLDAWLGPGTRIHAADGGTLENADGNRARVRKLRPDKTLVLDWQSDDLEAGTQVEVLFQPKGDKCGVVLNHTGIQDRARADAARVAWEDALRRLKEHVEA